MTTEAAETQGPAYYTVNAEELRRWVTEIFQRLGVDEADARVTAEVLVIADLRGVESHGVARLGRYTRGLQTGLIQPQAQPQIVHETPSTALVDAGHGLGQPASKWAMELAVRKAGETGHCSVSVRNSNHFGIAGYYAMMALPHDMIGVCYTNASPILVPTGARVAVVGTNPIAVAVPTDQEPAWVLDMATTVVPLGKLEVYNRKGLPMPPGWAVDKSGLETSDAGRVIDALARRAGGGIMPLGGAALTSG
ncbi:MAG: Ldh family oxidoreductase, partial [Chloroflexota bacterium]|nr:Ldh family oxidoreductase [Chloroflexota bacterium]